MKIDNSRVWTNVNVYDNCSTKEFLHVASILQSTFDIEFTMKMNDLDSIYWDFVFNGQMLCLHYNVYVGVSFFPASLNDASVSENQSVLDLYKKLETILQ